ncbi:unnamed protein product [Rotaria socialis]|uniref:Telomeric single stranded DNA binding POT1/Cdc13 domain-containing protein n=1 Tax=Rotaria socialis TaxID=392032 RepID=A0A818FFI7_9BILA|nr:unnamed protein product [Rotaria socialis]CAF3473032.1 unnamed protein product [Rotaria socialis]CAF3583811.1 unnamed protein product [Rotaria socialis]CAF3649389.1 unnamed protein product [Rotaria socialis]CAF4233756.1 unnamed protein product [Rotaria socialis]
MSSAQPNTVAVNTTSNKYNYKTIDELNKLIQPSGAKWCLYGVIKFRREINLNCMLIGICDPTSYGKGQKGASCLLYRESFAGTIELPIQAEIGQLIRLHRMKITNYKPESGCIQLKSSNFYSWLIFDGNDDISHEPVAQSSISYSFSNDDCQKIDALRAWLLSFGDNETLHHELDFQFALPELKSFNDQSTQTIENEMKDNSTTAIATVKDIGELSEFFSATDENESPKKRLHTD